MEAARRKRRSQPILTGQMVKRQAGHAMDFGRLNDGTPLAFGELAGGENIVSASPTVA
jgi:hypothetical protein